MKIDLHRISTLSRKSSTQMFLGEEKRENDAYFGVRTLQPGQGGKVILMEMTEREWGEETRGSHQPVLAEDGGKWNSPQEWQEDMQRQGWELVWMTPAKQRQKAREMRDWADEKEGMGWDKRLTENARGRSQDHRDRAEDLKKEPW